MNSVHDSLSDTAIAWIEEVVGRGAKVCKAERLKGGISSLVHRVTLRVGEADRDCVMRQFHDAEWLRKEPALAQREAANLRRAAMAQGVRTPSYVGHDETGARSGLPAVLMSRLEGEVVLEPAHPDEWADGLAFALARIHAIDSGGHPWTYAPYNDASQLDATAWSSVPEAWREAAAILSERRPAFAERFIHRDYHPANVLWKDGNVSGVVDWVNACIGPAGVDVGHCRVNLALLHGTEAAEAFLDRYIRHAGSSFDYDPYWDLAALIDFVDGPPTVYGGWTDLGFAHLTDELVKDRMDAHLLSILGR